MNTDICFNRTTVECKLIYTLQEFTPKNCFNRTTVECKYP